MIQFNKILVAVDFSEHSQVAVGYAAELSRAFDAEVILCHVVEQADMLSQLPPSGEAYFPPNWSQIQERDAREECERLLREAGIERSRVVIRAGTPFLEVVRLARDEQADLILVGTHGRGAIAHMLLGSVAETIVRNAPCPVLTVRQGEHEFVMP